MKLKAIKNLLILAVILAVSLVLASCDNVNQTQEPPSAAAQEGTLAIVESAAIEEIIDHQYVVVSGNYPDACTRISDVEQDVQGNTFNITLYTDKPADLVCAQMISPFAVNILLEVGGQTPGDYTVNINDSASTTFTIGN